MTDETSAQPTASQDLEWLSQPAGAPTTATLERPADEPASGRSFSQRAKAAGVFATALVVGAVGVFTLQSSSASPQAGNGPGGFGPPGANGQAPGGTNPGGRFGGVQGTVSAVSSSSITVNGTAYAVGSSTRVIVDGTPSTIAAIKQGDTVMVRANGTAAELVLAGTPGQGGPGGFGGPGGQGGFGPPGQPGTQQAPTGGNGTTSST